MAEQKLCSPNDLTLWDEKKEVSLYFNSRDNSISLIIDVFGAEQYQLDLTRENLVSLRDHIIHILDNSKW